MTSPQIVRAAIVVSLATTGGAIYYKLSEGGDPQVAQQKFERASAQLSSDVSHLNETLSDRIHPIVQNVQTAVSEVSQQITNLTTAPPATTSSPTSPSESPSTNSSSVSTAPESSDEYRGRPFCHTCSGPRIWFFAEKFRLKRRFTPYPDPPRE